MGCDPFQEAHVTPPQISVNELSKTYRVPERPPGLAASLRSLAHKTYRDVDAVRDVSFTIETGEIVGFIGPNGAGKTTTLKILAGLLHPTAGSVCVAGHVPWQRRPEYLRKIAMVLGNKSQLMWDIPALDTFRVLGEIYHVPPHRLATTVDELVDLLDMTDLLAQPVRNLSLGERIKCELVAALLHRPSVLFLDEPTLGLDVSMQRRLRHFISCYNRTHQATVILTSHYMADVVELCPRVILIHHGRLLHDGPLAELGARLAPFRLIRLTLGRPLAAPLPADAHLVSHTDGRLTLRVDRLRTSAVTAQLLNTLPVLDLAIEEPPIEAVIDQIYQEGIV
jgi:ABC-2 type transport system ATP-binding protein